jgi:hypothetical protein
MSNPNSRWHRDKEVGQLIEYLDQDEKNSFDLLTPGEVALVAKEIDRCRKDFVYAARNYFWLSNKNRDDQLFSLWPSQELILQKILEIKARNLPQKIIIIKARQLGCSTLIEALICWRTVFFSNVNALVVSKDINHAAHALWPIMQTMYDRLPWWLQPITSMRKSEEGMVFDNPDYTERRFNPGLSSRIWVKGATSGGVGQGIRLSACHVSEFADFEDHIAREIIDEDMGNALVESADTFAILESTAKGANRYAHHLWKRCEELERDAEWFPVFLPWFFEDTRIRVVMPDFRLEKPEILMRDRVEAEWVKCDYQPCRQYHQRWVRGEDRSGTRCLTCNAGTVHACILTDAQLHWIQHRRKNADRDEKSLKKLAQEMACVTGDTLVSTINGIMPIAQALTIDICDQGKITGWFNHGPKPIVELITQMGRRLRCTPDHRIFLPDGTCDEVQNLRVGQEIALARPGFATEPIRATWPHSPACEMSMEITEEVGRFLGYFMGDGCWIAGGLRFACDLQDVDVATDIAYLCEKIIGRKPRVFQRPGTKMLLVESVSVKWLPIMKGLGCLKKRGSDDKYIRDVHVPECVKQSPRTIVRQFLSALIECDGHAYKDSPRTVFFTAHDSFAQEVQLLLLGFGINTRVAVEDKVAGDGHVYVGRCIQFKAEASNLFHKEIGFIGRRKRTSACVRPQAINVMAKHRNRMVDWVAEILPAGVADVFDITVEKTHRFGANGILVHNSSAEEAFQVSGYQVFGQKAQAFASASKREPIAVGDFDNAGRLHGCNPKAPKKHGNHGEYHACFQEDCPLDHQFDDSPLHIFEWPESNWDYCIGADVAEGLGGKSDFSVGVCIRYSHTINAPNAQVAVWRSNRVDPTTFAAKLYHLGIMYKEALMAVEVNRYDLCLGALRNQLMYPNLYRWKHIDSVNMQSNKFGWETNLKSRPRLWQTFRVWLDYEMILVRSRNAIEEMKNFVKDDIDDIYGGADREEHDDELMSLMIALFCAVEGAYDERLGMATPREMLTMENARYRIECLNCHHRWPSQTAPDVDGANITPVLDNAGRVVASPGVTCPACHSRRIQIERNNSLISMPADTDRLLAQIEWTPESTWDNFQPPDYSLL